MILDSISGVICVNKAGETVTIPISELNLMPTASSPSNTSFLGQGSIPKSSQSTFVASGIIELDNGQIRLSNYTSKNSFTGNAIGLIGFDSSGNLVTYPISNQPAQNSGATQTIVSGAFNGTPFTIPVYNASGDDVDSSNMNVSSVGNWYLGQGNPFFKFGIGLGSMNIDQGSVADAYRMNGKVVITVDREKNEVFIGNTLYTATNIETLKTRKVVFDLPLGGTISDIGTDTSGDFTLIKPAKNGTYAVVQDIVDTAWLLTANTLTAKSFLGSVNNFDVGFKRNNVEYFTLDASKINVLKDITSTGSLTLGTISAESTDVDKFLVSNAGLIKYRTGTQLLSDIGAFASPTGLTTNYVTKWNGTALSNSQIVDNGTNVLIGTTTDDGYKFLVSGNTRLRQPSGTNSILSFFQAGVAEWTIGQRSNQSFVINNGGNFAGTDAITILQNGNVGIGTTSPTLAKLQVNGAIYQQGADASGVGIYTNGALRFLSNTNFIDFNYSGAANSVSFRNGSGVRTDLFISATGNIGVGNTNNTYKLDVTGTGHFTGSVTFDTVPSSLQDATSSNHLVRYSQWIASTSVKYLPTAVRTVSLANITLSGTQTVNGVALAIGDRILVAGQTAQTGNGVYVVASGAWTRATDSDTDAELRGFIISVTSGAYAGYKYINTNASAITIGTTAITYSEFSNVSENDPIFTAWRDQSRTANTFWAAPNGSNGAATWRALTVADVPTLNQNTTGSAGSLATSRNIAISGDLSWNVNFNGSVDVTAIGTLATVNSNTGTFAGITVNAKGLVTGAVALTTIAGYGITNAYTKAETDTLLSGKENTITAGTAAQYWRGDKTWQTLNKASVGLGSVENTALSTWAGSANITTLGNIGSGTWNGTTIAINKGGTGLTALGTANQLLRVNSGATALEYFTPTFISGNQTITLSGIVTGSGTTAITTSIADNALSIAKTSGLQTALDARMITSSYPDLVAIEALSGTSGLLKKTAANTWALDTTSYQTALSGTGFMSSVDTTISYSKNINLEKTTLANQNGIIQKNGVAWLHDFNYGTYNGINTIGENVFIGSPNITSGKFAQQTWQGSYNVGVGGNALLNNGSGAYNVALGHNSLFTNGGGHKNIGLGFSALYFNIGDNNIAIGANSLYSNVDGYNNIAIGNEALYSNNSGFDNTAIGLQSMYLNTTGRYNLSLGHKTLYSNTSGQYNVALSYLALNKNTTGSYNFAAGQGALVNNTTGSLNIAIGFSALDRSLTSSNNIAIGVSSMRGVVTGAYNIALGQASLGALTSGASNTALGYQSGLNLTTGSNNVFLGYQSGLGITTGSNNVIIGANTTGLNSALSNYIILGDNAGFRRFVINDLGNAGLGIDNPLYKLHVVGDIKTTSNLIVDGSASFGTINPLTIEQKYYIQGSITSNYNEISSLGKWLRLNTDSGFSLRHNEVDAISFTEGNWKFNTNFSVTNGEEINDWTGFNVDDRFRIGINEVIGLAAVEMVYENSIIRNYWDSDGIFTHVDNAGNSRKYLREGDVVGGSTSIPNLQQVTEQGANSTVRMQFNGSNYATLSDLGVAQGLDSVLGNNNTANNKNIFLNGLSSAYTLGWDGTAKFFINHSIAGTLNLVQTAGNYMNITAADILDITAASLLSITANSIGVNSSGNIGFGTTAGISLQSATGSFYATNALALQSGTGDLDLVTNSGFINIGINNTNFSKTKIGKTNANDYIYLNGQKYNFALPTVSSGDYLILQVNSGDVTVKKATIFASGGKNYLTV